MKNRTKYLIISLVLLAIVGASQVFLPAINGSQNTPNDKAYWMAKAETAWQFYQPGKAVNEETGLHGAGLEWPFFTEWDLGTYIQAMIDARSLGLLKNDGPWGFDYRIEKVMGFLQTRKLTNDSIPYLTYDCRTGEPYGDTPSFSIDEGKLILALFHLKSVRPDLSQAIDYVVKVRNNITNYGLYPKPESWSKSTDFYTYYIAWAFKVFGLAGWDSIPSEILSNINSQPRTVTYGVALPQAHITTEPMLLTKFEINPSDPGFTQLLYEIYLAQEARYNSTGNYTAFSEGNTGLDNPGYIYEFVVDTDGSTWKVNPPTTPIAYFKVAVGFQAVFFTNYTNKMVNYMESSFVVSPNGYQDGVAEDGRVVNTVIDRTNGLVLSAAKYVIDNLVSSSPSPSPSLTVAPTVSQVPTSNPTSSPAPTETFNFSPSPTPLNSSSVTPSTSVSPSVSPTFSPSPEPSSDLPVVWIIAPIAAVVPLAVVGVVLLNRRSSRSARKFSTNLNFI